MQKGPDYAEHFPELMASFPIPASHRLSPRSAVSAERSLAVVPMNCGALPRRRYARAHGPIRVQRDIPESL